MPGGWEVLFGAVAGWWVLAGVWWLLGQLALCKEARSGAKTPLLPPEQGR